jgi:NAD(P)-dependent dehydrogenase (short-subunit alcohol dehydrogenase family)
MTSPASGHRDGDAPTIVMTGATSGFGEITATRLTGSGGTRLIVGARRPAPVGESIPLDLATLGSVRAFAAAVRERLGPDKDPDRDVQASKAGQHAYTASKLCAVLTARRLSRCDDVQAKGLTVIAYDSGQVFGTGLTKDLSLPLRAAWHVATTWQMHYGTTAPDSSA